MALCERSIGIRKTRGEAKLLRRTQDQSVASHLDRVRLLTMILIV
jgi:hypothetical protein